MYKCLLQKFTKSVCIVVPYFIVHRRKVENSPGTIVQNQAPHVNFCHPVLLKSYGSKLGSKSFEGYQYMNLVYFLNNL